MKLTSVLSALALTGVLVTATDARADRVNRVEVTSVGCQTNSDTCFAYLSVEVGQASVCRNKSVRWQGEGTNGKNVLSVFTAAYLAGKKVTVSVSDSTCISGFPSVVWARMEN